MPGFSPAQALSFLGGQGEGKASSVLFVQLPQRLGEADGGAHALRRTPQIKVLLIDRHAPKSRFWRGMGVPGSGFNSGWSVPERALYWGAFPLQEREHASGVSAETVIDSAPGP
jgi:hypothetical protein